MYTDLKDIFWKWGSLPDYIASLQPNEMFEAKNRHCSEETSSTSYGQHVLLR